MDTEALRHRMDALLKLAPAARVALLGECLGVAGPDEVGPITLALLDLAIVPGEERPRQTAPRLIRLYGHFRRRARAGVHLAALSELVRRWSAVPEDLRYVVTVAGRGRLAQAAHAVLASDDPQARLGVCAAAWDTGEFALAPILATLFEDREPAVAAAAERALARMAYRAASIDPDSGEDVPDDEAASRDDQMEQEAVGLLVGAVASVMPVAAAERRRPALVAAMALLAPARLARARSTRSDPLSAWFTGADEAARGALRAALRWTEAPLARRRALEWLSIDALGAAAAERLDRARTPAEHQCVLTRAHLLAHPARARRAAILARQSTPAEPARPLPGCVPPPELIPSLTREARRAVPGYLRAVGAGVEALRRVLEPLLADGDALVRLACTRAAPPGALADLCFDPDRRVARSAVLAWSLAGERAGGAAPGRRLALRPDAARERMLSRLARSPHAPVRAIARQEIALVAWLDPGTPAGRAAARRRLLHEPEALLADLRALLLAGGADDRVAAVQTARGLRLHAHLERELLTLCGAPAEGDGARVAATSIAALAELGTPEAARAVAGHVGASDPRVRANAVEGVGLLARAPARTENPRGLLVELKDDPHHRVRANALRALLTHPAPIGEAGVGGGAAPGGARGTIRMYEPAAAQALLAMLVDDRPEHRLAGAWVAGRTLPFEGAARLGPRWVEIGVRVHELASGDVDARVRVRAAQCATLLRARLGTAALSGAGA